MSKLKTTLLVMFTVGMFFQTVASTSAQPPTRRRYIPRRPTMSPYLDYFRRDTGLLDPYNTFQRPQVRMRQFYQQQQQQIYRQQQQLEQQKMQFQQIQGSLRQFRESGASPTGHGATFMNYSHYFGQNPTGGGAAASGSPTRPSR